MFLIWKLRKYLFELWKHFFKQRNQFYIHAWQISSPDHKTSFDAPRLKTSVQVIKANFISLIFMWRMIMKVCKHMSFIYDTVCSHHSVLLTIYIKSFAFSISIILPIDTMIWLSQSLILTIIRLKPIFIIVWTHLSKTLPPMTSSC